MFQVGKKHIGGGGELLEIKNSSKKTKCHRKLKGRVKKTGEKVWNWENSKRYPKSELLEFQ